MHTRINTLICIITYSEYGVEVSGTVSLLAGHLIHPLLSTPRLITHPSSLILRDVRMVVVAIAGERLAHIDLLAQRIQGAWTTHLLGKAALHTIADHTKVADHANILSLCGVEAIVVQPVLRAREKSAYMYIYIYTFMYKNLLMYISIQI